MAWFEEFLCVLAYSRRTQWAIGLGVGGFIVVLLMGDYFVSQLQFDGLWAPFTKPLGEVLAGRYDKAAWSILGSSLLAALKCYRKDRKRFLNMF